MCNEGRIVDWWREFYMTEATMRRMEELVTWPCLPQCLLQWILHWLFWRMERMRRGQRDSGEAEAAYDQRRGWGWLLFSWEKWRMPLQRLERRPDLEKCLPGVCPDLILRWWRVLQRRRFSICAVWSAMYRGGRSCADTIVWWLWEKIEERGGLLINDYCRECSRPVLLWRSGENCEKPGGWLQCDTMMRERRYMMTWRSIPCGRGEKASVFWWWGEEGR